MMKRRFITIGGETLARALKLCNAVVERRNTYPVLGMVRLAVDGTRLTLSATDLDMVLSIPLTGVDGGGVWAICLPARPLETVARLGREGNIMLEAIAGTGGDETARHVRVSLDQGDLFESCSYEIEGLASDAFPELAGERGRLIESFGNGRFGELLRKVSWASSTEETRYYLNGVALEIGPNGRRLIATDGHRLALCHYDKVGEGSEAVTRVLPNKLVAVLGQIGGSDVVLHAVTGKDGAPAPWRIEAACADGVTVRSKLIELDGVRGYPEVDRVIPSRDSWKFAIGLKAGQVTAAIERAMAFVGKHTGKYVGFGPTPDGQIKIRSRSVDIGSAEIILPVAWPPEASEFGFNGSLMKQLLRHCDGDVVFHLVAPSAPLTILDGDETMTRLLMPMRA